MKKPLHPLSRLLGMVLFGVVVLALFTLILTAALPGSAAVQSLRPEALTNSQLAAILGGQSLLAFVQYPFTVYLPTVTK